MERTPARQAFLEELQAAHGATAGARQTPPSPTTTAEGRGESAQPSFGWVLTTLGRVLIDCNQRLRRGEPDSSFFPSGVPLK